MSVINHTPFPALAFRQYNLSGHLNGVLTVRGSFRLVPREALRLAERQLPLVMADEYAGDPLATDLIRQSDLVPFKPGTDVTFIGETNAPGGRPLASWTCGLSVGPVSKRLRVYGPRNWIELRDPDRKRLFREDARGKRTGWTLSEPMPVSQVDLIWANSYGGKIPFSPLGPEDADPANTIGKGIVTADIPDDIRCIPAHQIEDDGKSVARWDERATPQNLGPVPPFWKQRLRYAGTYDDAWLNNRHPLLPSDFDFRFWQCAPEGLTSSHWLTGDEPFELHNLVSGQPLAQGFLPGISLRMGLKSPSGFGVCDLVLDGVHFDFRRGEGMIYLTWRAGFPWADGEGQPELVMVQPTPEAADG